VPAKSISADINIKRKCFIGKFLSIKIILDIIPQFQKKVCEKRKSKLFLPCAKSCLGIRAHGSFDFRRMPCRVLFPFLKKETAQKCRIVYTSELIYDTEKAPSCGTPGSGGFFRRYR
jgi:hypothetical protein